MISEFEPLILEQPDGLRSQLDRLITMAETEEVEWRKKDLIAKIAGAFDSEATRVWATAELVRALTAAQVAGVDLKEVRVNQVEQLDRTPPWWTHTPPVVAVTSVALSVLAVVAVILT